MLRKYFCLTILFVLSKNVDAQWWPPVLYQTFSDDTTIQCIDATDGYWIIHATLWVGTNKGLFGIKDFSQTIHFDSTNSSLPSNEITAVDVDNDQDFVWAGTNHGICRHSLWDTTWTCFSTSNSSLPSDSITCILAFREDSVWIGTKDGLVLFTTNPDTFILFNQSNSALPGNHVQCLERFYFIPYFYYPEPLYVGTDSGIVTISGAQWSVFNKLNSGLLSDNIKSIATEFGYNFYANIWIATYGGGVSHLSDTAWTTFTHSNSKIKTDSLDFIENITWYSHTVCGSKRDSVYLQTFNDTGSFHGETEIQNPIISVSRSRGNGSWLWISNEHEIYRSDMTEGIFDPSNFNPSWQATMNGTYLHLFNLPSINANFVMKIYDVLGNIVFQNQFFNHQTSSASFTIPQHSQGIYLVELEYPDHIEAVKTIKAE